MTDQEFLALTAPPEVRDRGVLGLLRANRQQLTQVSGMVHDFQLLSLILHEKIFSRYCKIYHSANTTSSWEEVNRDIHTIDVNEFLKFCRDTRILPEQLSNVDITKVQIINKMLTVSCTTDIYSQLFFACNRGPPSKQGGGEIEGLSFRGFVECVARCALAAFPEYLEQPGPKTTQPIRLSPRERVEQLFHFISEPCREKMNVRFKISKKGSREHLKKSRVNNTYADEDTSGLDFEDLHNSANSSDLNNVPESR